MIKPPGAILTALQAGDAAPWNAWREQTDYAPVDLRRVNLRGALLLGVDLRGALLLGVDLRAALLRGADLRWADLRGADLRWALLDGADLQGTDLRWADLRWALLEGADLQGTDLRWALLDGAKLGDLAFLPGLVTIQEVARVVLAHPDRLDMSDWHSDDEWRNGEAKPLHECKTTHCIAGWAEYLGALKDPRVLTTGLATVTLAHIILGDEAERHFYASNDDALAYLQSALQSDTE